MADTKLSNLTEDTTPSSTDLAYITADPGGTPVSRKTTLANLGKGITGAAGITVADESSDTTCFPLFVTAATGDLGPKTAAGLTFNASTDVLSATGFSGPLTGNVTGNCSGTAATVTGATQASITTCANLTTTGTITAGGLGTGSVIGAPTMTLGSDADFDLYYRDSNVLTRLGPNTAASNKFLRMIGTGAAGQAPSWEALVAGDIPDISATYSVVAGNASLVTVGTVTTGTWTATDIGPEHGGTGVSNGSNNTITFTGNYTLGVTLSNNTAVTLPTSGTLMANVVEDTTPQLGGDLDMNNKNIKATAALGTDETASGIVVTLTANENQAFGDIGYINTDGEVQLGDADAIATSSCVAMCADDTINADASGNYLLFGIARDDTWNWTVGGLIYLSLTGTTGNTLTQTAPSGEDDVIQIVGVATHADRMLFMPNLVQVEHAA